MVLFGQASALLDWSGVKFGFWKVRGSDEAECHFYGVMPVNGWNV
jgi:hypothetical protein